MKKCPACRSISANGKTTCGVCGESLEHVDPLVKTLDQNILEDRQEDSAFEQKFARKVWEMRVSKLLAVLSVGLIMVGSGIILVNYNGLQWGPNGIIWGFLLLPVGLFITASAILGGLGPSAANPLWHYRNFRMWLGGVGSVEWEDEKTNKDNAKAESVERRRESDETRREREKNGVD